MVGRTSYVTLHPIRLVLGRKQKAKKTKERTKTTGTLSTMWLRQIFTPLFCFFFWEGGKMERKTEAGAAHRH